MTPTLLFLVFRYLEPWSDSFHAGMWPCSILWDQWQWDADQYHGCSVQCIWTCLSSLSKVSVWYIICNLSHFWCLKIQVKSEASRGDKQRKLDNYVCSFLLFVSSIPCYKAEIILLKVAYCTTVEVLWLDACRRTALLTATWTKPYVNCPHKNHSPNWHFFLLAKGARVWELPLYRCVNPVVSS